MIKRLLCINIIMKRHLFGKPISSFNLSEEGNIEIKAKDFDALVLAGVSLIGQGMKYESEESRNISMGPEVSESPEMLFLFKGLGPKIILRYHTGFKYDPHDLGSYNDDIDRLRKQAEKSFEEAGKRRIRLIPIEGKRGHYEILI
jgi:hypothetical protein